MSRAYWSRRLFEIGWFIDNMALGFCYWWTLTSSDSGKMTWLDLMVYHLQNNLKSAHSTYESKVIIHVTTLRRDFWGWSVFLRHFPPPPPSPVTTTNTTTSTTFVTVTTAALQTNSDHHQPQQKHSQSRQKNNRKKKSESKRRKERRKSLRKKKKKLNEKQNTNHHQKIIYHNFQ